jgi:hypothetical protein
VKRPFQMFTKNIAGKQEGREYGHRHSVITYYNFFRLPTYQLSLINFFLLF